MARQKLTPIEAEFAKEKRRIQQIIRRAKKRGFILPITAIKTPEEITREDILELQTITPETLYRNAQFKDPMSGEIFTGEEGRQIERYRSHKKAAETRRGARAKKEEIHRQHPRSSELSKEYTQESARIKQFIKRAQNRGYVFSDDILGERPRQITQADVDRLKALTPEELYKQAEYVSKIDPNTGEVTEIISGTEGRKRERQTSAAKSKHTREINKKQVEPEKPRAQERPEPILNDTVLKNLEDELSNWQPVNNWSVYMKNQKIREVSQCRSILKIAIDEFGRDVIARRVEENAFTIRMCIPAICYDSDGTNVAECIQTFIEILFNRAVDDDESAEISEYAEQLYYYGDDETEDTNINVWS